MTTPGTTLDLYRGELVARMRGWTGLAEDERRRRAVEAARDLDVEVLWSLTEAHVTTFGPAGASVSVRTLRAYREAVAAFVRYAGENAVNLLRPGATVGHSWMRALEAAGRSPATLRVKLAGARALYRALRWAGATGSDPFSDARPRVDRTAPWDKREPYGDGEVEVLLSAAPDDLRVLLLLGAHAGLRLEEALRLAWVDVDLSARQLTVRAGKGGKTRRVRLSVSLAGALERWGRGEGTLFGTSQTAARKRLARLCRRTGVAYKGFHALRHTAGTRLYRETRSLDAVARHLGHASLDTARVYAKWGEDLHDRTVGGW